jgi:hypothetical protein
MKVNNFFDKKGLNETKEGEKKNFSEEFQNETYNDLKEKPLGTNFLLIKKLLCPDNPLQKKQMMAKTVKIFNKNNRIKKFIFI